MNPQMQALMDMYKQPERLNLLPPDDCSGDEGSVYRNSVDTYVRLYDKWNKVTPETQDQLRRDWLDWKSKQPQKNIWGNGVNNIRKPHRGTDIGKQGTGVHLHHVDEVMPTVHILSEEELDNKTLESFQEGFAHARKRIVQELTAIGAPSDIIKKAEETQE